MLVLMKPDATPSDVQEVEAVITGLGFTAHRLPGSQRVAIGITGNDGAIDPATLPQTSAASLDAASGVFLVDVTPGSPTVGKGASSGRVTTSQLREIAAIKMKDMNANDVDGAVSMLRGSARSMGLSVVEG